MKRKERGITLIALVITIIVLLILAGVAISMLSGENGILKKATEAKTKTEEKSIEEQIKLAVMSATEAGTTKVDKQKIANELSIEKSSINGDSTDIVLTMKEKTFNVKKGKIYEVSAIKDIDNILDEYFQENNMNYKCRYGYVTGIEVGTTVEKLQGALPTGYSVKAIDGTDTFTNKNKEGEYVVTTGLQIVNSEGQEVARTVIFGDTDCDGGISLVDTLPISNYSNSEVNFENYQIVAMNTNHDLYIYPGCTGIEDINSDTKEIMEESLESAKIDQNVYASSSDDLKPINVNKIINEAREKLKNKGYEITKEINELEVDEYIVYGIDKTITVGDLKKQLGDGYFIITYGGKEIPEDKMIVKGYYIGVKNIFNTFITVVKIN